MKKPLDFESDQSYLINLRIIDRGRSVVHQFEINVIDSNDKPSKILIGNNDNTVVYENLVGVNIGMFSTIDDDRNQLYTYTC